MRKTKSLVLILTSSLLILTLLGYSAYMLIKSRTFQIFGELTSRVNTSEKVVALTFDDGPSSTTNEVLDLLAEKNVRATFYVIGQNIEKYPEETKMIVEQGHELGNHSYSHQRLIFKSQSFIQNEIEKTNQLIRNAGYDDKITFRPPNGKKLFGLPWYLSRHNIETIMWDVEPDTYYREDASLITKYAIETAKQGSIILLHPFSNSGKADIESLPKIIDGLTANGYKFITVNQLLEYKK